MVTRKCPMQHGLMMSEAFCDSAQNSDLCAGCQYNEGREISKYQQEKRFKENT